MAVKVSPDQLGQAILKELEIYTEEVSEAVSKVVCEEGKKAAKELRTKTNGGKWDRYPHGWTSTTKAKKDRTVSTVHNKQHYRLTHLLENGHVIKNGTGRTYGTTRKFEHIGPVHDKAVKDLEEKIKEAIEKA